MKKNSIITVKIENISGDSSGIAKFNGEVIFVPNTAVGDEVEIVIIKELKNYSIGKVKKLLLPSPLRTEPDCDVYTMCGGCVFRHITLKEEERIKKENVRSVMQRIAKAEVTVRDTVTPVESGYRNKAQLPVSEDEKGLHCGFYRNHSHAIIDNSLSCVLSPKIFEDISLFILDFMKREKIKGYNEEKKSGVVRHLYYRINCYGEVAVTVVTNTKKLISDKVQEKFAKELTSTFKEIRSVFINYNPKDTNVILGEEFELIWGEKYLRDELLGCKFIMSPDSFFQVNRLGAEVVYKTAFSLLKEKHYENVYDLYCGIGSIGITLFAGMKSGNIKASASRLFGVEIVEKAIACAKVNAKENGIENAEFFATDSSDITKSDLFDKFPPSLVILDPPRKGTTTELLDFLIEKNVSDILYISCDPATLARDMGYLITNGYTASEVCPVNLFPKTKHSECAVLLYRS